MNVTTQDWDFAQYLLNEKKAEFVPKFESFLKSLDPAGVLQAYIRFSGMSHGWGRCNRTTSKRLESSMVLVAINEILGYPENMKYLKLGKTPSGFMAPKTPSSGLITEKEWAVAENILTGPCGFLTELTSMLDNRYTLGQIKKLVRTYRPPDLEYRSSLGILRAVEQMLGFQENMKYLGLANEANEVDFKNPTNWPKPVPCKSGEEELAEILIGNKYFGKVCESFSSRHIFLEKLIAETKLSLTGCGVDWNITKPIDVLKQVWIKLGRPIAWEYLWRDGVKKEDMPLSDKTPTCSDLEKAIAHQVIKDGSGTDLATIDPQNRDTIRRVANAIYEIYDGVGWDVRPYPQSSEVAKIVINHYLEKEIPIMAPTQKFFSTKFLINGLDIEGMTNNEIYNCISRQSDKIKGLEAIPTQPKMLKDEIAAEKADLEALVKYLDSKSAKAE